MKNEKGLAGHYRRFIPNFAKLPKSLTKLLQKNTPFQFNKNCIEPFRELKQALTTTLILIYPNFEETLILTTNSSDFPIGAVRTCRKTFLDSICI